MADAKDYARVLYRSDHPATLLFGGGNRFLQKDVVTLGRKSLNGLDVHSVLRRYHHGVRETFSCRHLSPAGIYIRVGYRVLRGGRPPKKSRGSATPTTSAFSAWFVAFSA